MQLPPCYLFQGLAPPQLDRIAAISRQENVRKGQWLFREDQAAERVFILLEGAVELVTFIDETIEIPIAIIRTAGGCFGLGALVEPYTYTLSARCVDESLLLAIPTKELRRLCRSEPQLGTTLMTNVAGFLIGRLKETRQEIKVHFKNLIRNATL